MTICVDELARRLVVHVVQYRLGRGALRNSPVSLQSASLLHWGLAVEHLQIDNTLGGNWSSPFALHIDRLRIELGGPAALLSLLQLPTAAAFGSPCILRLGGLEFVMGFRVKVIEVLEISGLTVHLEDAEVAQGLPPPPEAILKRGLLRKVETRNHGRELEFVLERSRLSWYEPGALDPTVGGPRAGERREESPKAKGSLRLYSSSAIEMPGDGSAGHSPSAATRFEVITHRERLGLHALSVEERDAWGAAIEHAVTNLALLGAGQVSTEGRRRGGSNAPWLEVLEAENEARKVRWQRRESQRRREWRQRWRRKGAPQEEGDEDDDDDDDDDEDDDEAEAAVEGEVEEMEAEEAEEAEEEAEAEQAEEAAEAEAVVDRRVTSRGERRRALGEVVRLGEELVRLGLRWRPDDLATSALVVGGGSESSMPEAMACAVRAPVATVRMSAASEDGIRRTPRSSTPAVSALWQKKPALASCVTKSSQSLGIDAGRRHSPRGISAGIASARAMSTGTVAT